MESVYCHGKCYHLRLGDYYHLTKPKDILLWNARIGQGVVHTISAIADTKGLQYAATPYYILNAQPKKENKWEEVRRTEFPDKPTRLKALFLFDDLDAARTARNIWFPNEGRHILKTRVVSYAALHRADAAWLETCEHAWISSARSYWSGRMTGAPRAEVIVYGSVYFPGWREALFDQLPEPSL